MMKLKLEFGVMEIFSIFTRDFVFDIFFSVGIFHRSSIGVINKKNENERWLKWMICSQQSEKWPAT